MQESVEILLVEDSPGDACLIRDALVWGGVPKQVEVVNNGEDALSYLLRYGPFRDAVRPDLILLDLNLPGVDGREVLAIVKTNRELRHIPILVLTTSEAEADVVACYDNHANCYLKKPQSLDELLELVEQVETYWLGHVALPSV